MDFRFSIENSVILTDETDIPSSLLLDVNEAIDHGGYASVTVTGGKIISAAVVAPSPRMGGELEMTVETAPDYRGQGYATANVAALAAHLSGQSRYFYYLVRSGNPASLSIAKKLGLNPTDINITGR